ncbi:DUF554 domain-containing protein [Atopobium fossor]|uniref:DUF554 domain-containing protein n=1 Tax=Atopobium fossor TaxID=39487 RepID=UPI0003F9FE51|nr:DUF554 domain-containing protein [Atopobium fossor]
MVILGALVNGIAALVGGALGMIVGTKLKQDMGNFLMVGMGLCVVLAGVQGMAAGGSVLQVTLAITLGGIIGHLINLDGIIHHFGDRIQDRMQAFAAGNPAFANMSAGFVNATLVICIGSMAIVGSLQSGLTLDHSTLFAKSLMDMIITMLLATTMGAGVMLSSLVVFAYEALLSLGASFIAPYLTQAVITQMLATGSLLLFAVGLNLAKITDIKVANFLPACFLPIVLVPLLMLCGLM